MFPSPVTDAFQQSKSPAATVLVLRILPDWFDAFAEQVQVRGDGEGGGTMQVAPQPAKVLYRVNWADRVHVILVRVCALRVFVRAGHVPQCPVSIF